MTITTAIILGLLQALGEFLPISSSAHLVLFSFFTGKEYQGLTFDVLLHLATLIAVCAYFYKDLLVLTKKGLTEPKSEDGRLFWYIGLATIPAAVAGYFLEDLAENTFRAPWILALNLIIFAILLFIADRKGKQNIKDNLSLRIMMLIGCAQALALVPGVSRSGITITAALFLGLTRSLSARISFLLSMPIIAGAAVLKISHLSLSQINAPLIAGFFSALIGGWLVIKFLMKYIQNHNFDIFVYYRIALGILILLKLAF
jgi:undecaprenyl-diphosphatase